MLRLLLAGVLLMGCNAANKELDELADRACACKDAACAKSTLDDFVSWAKQNEDATGDVERAKDSASRLVKCVAAAGVSQVDLMIALDKFKQ